ncbi:MAG TPA: hypothetical protein VF721_03130 [Pyrinomonadaceae bacterium]|jgi:hypothetical protein
MFDEIDKQLESWAKDVFEDRDFEISFAAPAAAAAETEKTSVYLYLLDVIPAPPARATPLPPLQVTLRYLVVPQAKTPELAHRLLGSILIAAMENAEFEVEKESLPLDLWQAFGIAPRPSFILRVPFKHERKETPAPPVRFPLTIRQTAIVRLRGQVTLNQIPLAAAKVEIPLLRLFTETDTDGKFRFGSLPPEPKDKKLLIRAKGREFSVSTSQAQRRGDLFLIDLKLED